MGGRASLGNLWRVLPSVALLCQALPAHAGPPDASGISYDQHPGQALPPAARFVDQHGRDIALSEMTKGHPTILALGYFACPALCGLMREDLFSALSQSGLQAGVDYELAFISIDPAERPGDAAQAMTADLAAFPSFGNGRGWHFLTGNAASITAVERAVGFRSRYDLTLKQFIHPAGLVIVNARGLVSGYVLGIGYRPGDLRAGIIRAHEGGIAKAALPVLLICFHYDSTTGRYSLAIIKLLRIAAGATLLGIAGLLFLLRRRTAQRVR